MHVHLKLNPSNLSSEIDRFGIQLLGYLAMKNIVRAFVVVLALTGAAASTQTSSASSSSIITAKVSASPTPVCPPNAPNACGMRGGW